MDRFSLTRWTLLAAVGMIGCFAQPVAAAQNPTAVAVVDIQKVLKNLDERDYIQADFTSKAEAMDRERLERAQELKEIEEELTVLQPGTADFKQREEEYQRKAIELKVWSDHKKRLLEREAALQWEGMYRKITAAIERTAKRDAIGLVLLKDDDDITGSSQKEVGAKMMQRKILYAAPELDITDQITQMLNNEFVNRPK